MSDKLVIRGDTIKKKTGFSSLLNSIRLSLLVKLNLLSLLCLINHCHLYQSIDVITKQVGEN